MKKIEVQGSLTIECDGNLYTVTSDVYSWDPEYVYNQGENVLYRNKLYKAKTKTLGAWLCNFELVKPTDTVTYSTTNDDLIPIYKSLDEIRKALKLDPPEQDDIDPGFGQNPCLPPSGSGDGSDSGDSSGSGDEIDPGFTYPDVNQLLKRIDTIEQTYVRTINNESPLNGNINIDVDGSVMPPESDILRWTNNVLNIPQENKLAFVVDDTPINAMSYQDNTLNIGDTITHLDLLSIDNLTVNGETVLTVQDAVDLTNDQNIQGRKHFDTIFTTESPLEDQQVPNKKWIEDFVTDSLERALKPQIKAPTTLYIDAYNISDTENGTEEFGFKTLKNAVEFLKSAEINHQPITIEILNRYYDASEMLELPEFGSNITIISRSGLDVELPPLYITGKWRLENVTVTDNRLQQCPIEVDRGFCTLKNVNITLKSPALGTDAIFIHNSGIVQLASASILNIENTTSTLVSHAIHIKAGTFIGNEDVHSNVGETNTIDIRATNGSFGVAFVLENGSRALYLENTRFVKTSIMAYVVKQGSILQGISDVDGERDASSMVISY